MGKPPSLSPSHLNDFLECEHLAALGLAVSPGEIPRVQPVELDLPDLRLATPRAFLDLLPA